ncbi:probable E3 ubiquitin-protein ligase RHB1A isoform X2 [Salvia splendens]|uniref:probable E3 ubiquitin-protein ligase RHB1A isoform X2 n=1 Tax=Salvia splendens TaxID=180675 RepID=UPI001C280168|nr:probable E3 ubiquitin-protein ligase RHB1A isoform X2 [Salvia splendens]
MKHPVSEEHEPLSSHNEISAFSTGLLVDTNLDTSVPDTYRPPPAPIPYETYIGRPSTPSRNQEESGHETEVALGITNVVRVEDINHGSQLETKVKKQPDNEEKDVDLEASKLMEDESSDELKKSSKVLDAPIIDEDDCPICLEEYVEDNPKILTKCDHHFHLACILEWMERSDICPVCDQEMVISPAAGV